MNLSKPQQSIFFSLILSIKKVVIQKTIMTVLFQVIYLVELTCIFLIIVNSHQTFIADYLDSFLLFLLITITSSIILAQLVVAAVWNLHFQLYNQLLFFRYAIVPLMMIFLANQMRIPHHLLVEVSYVLIFLLVFVIFMLCNIVFYQCSENELIYSSSQYSKYLILIDLMMVLVLPKKGTIWEPIFEYIWLILNILIHTKLKNQVRRNITDKFMGFTVYYQLYLLVLLLANALVYAKPLHNKVFIVTSPIALLIFLYSFFSEGKETIEASIFRGEATQEQFVRFLYVMSHELNNVKGNLNVKFQHSFLMLFIAAHQNECGNSACLLNHPSTSDEIQTSSEQGPRKMVIFKVIKKVESLMDLYEEKYPNNLQLKLLKMQFYSVHLNNKLKIKHIISGIEYRKLSTKNKIVVFEINQRAHQMTSNDYIDSAQNQDQFQIFKKKMMEMILTMREFWNALGQDKVDLNNLVQRSSKVFPIKREVEKLWKSNLNEEKFVSWNILKTYIFYCRVILHDFTKAYILDDYCQILQTRLKNKQELGYLKFDTESGVVAISLSETSLGQIHNVNMLAVRLFSFFSSKEMLSLRVNDIMPDVYSINHDSILTSFLRNRSKSINQDQRLLFGKGKNGFIFPMSLQLRKIIYNTNDQLMFISNVNAIKTKSAPIFCIVDLEGDIKNMTSTFAWLFLRKFKNVKMDKDVQNIQVIIPSFFKVIQDNEDNRQSVYVFEERCVIKKSTGDFQIQFTGEPLLIKGKKVGYRLEGHTAEPQNSMCLFQKGIQQMMKSSKQKMDYNAQQNTYEISKGRDLVEKQKTNQFLIPFLQTNDLQLILTANENAFAKGKRVFGEDIKTFRLTNNHLKIAMEQPSFSSEMSDSNWRETSLRKRIELMKEQINVDNSDNVTNSYKTVILVFTIIICILCSIWLLQTFIFRQRRLRNEADLYSKWKVRQLLPELLVYSYFPSSINNNTTKIDTLRTDFVKSLHKSSVEQWQKQSMLQLINFARFQRSITFEPNLLTFHQEFTKQTLLLVCIFLVLTAELVFIVAVLLIYSHFDQTIQKLYTIFLSINQKKLQSILSESQMFFQFLKKSSPNSNNSNFEVEQKQQKYSEQKDDEEQSLGMKKIKKKNSEWDMHIVCKLVFPLVLIVAVGVIGCIFMTIALSHYEQDLEIWVKQEELLPYASLTTMQQLFKFLNMTGNFSLPNQFYQLEMNYEHSLILSNFDLLLIEQLIKGDLCLSPTHFPSLPAELKAYCQAHPNIDNSLGTNLNFLNSFLTGNVNQTNAKWNSIVQIQYQLIKPLFWYVLEKIKLFINEELKKVMNYFVIFAILHICLIILIAIYLFRFPLQDIDQRIKFTKDLISIIPSQKQKAPILTLTALTKEAVHSRN